MTDKELAEFLRKRECNENIIFSKTDLPEPRATMETVTLYRDQLCRFRDSMATLQAFAAQVCGVSFDELCLMDMYKFLCNRWEGTRTMGKKRTDKMRLDYIQKIPHTDGILFRHEWSDGTSCWGLINHYRTFSTVRQVIDAAMDQEERRK